jgi:uncharacterized membrane protein YhaH (DUF805 family)
MDCGEAISAGFSKFRDLGDRACRSEYWYWSLFMIATSVVASIIDAALNSHFLLGIFWLVTIVPSLAVAIRRLHDLDRSGRWFLVGFIPLVGWIILLFWYCTKGTAGFNRFGPNPLTLNQMPRPVT